MIAVHCGAGYHGRDLEAAYKRDLGAACRAGAAVLAGGGDALAAVTAAIKVLEDSEHGNAGHGSNLSFNGVVECDASVMAGDGAFGAVAAAPGIANPVEAAAALAREGRLPLTHGRVRPMVLAGDRAREWALSRGLSAAPSAAEATGWHLTDRSKQQWRKYRQMVDEGDGGQGGAAAQTPSGSAAAGEPGQEGQQLQHQQAEPGPQEEEQEQQQQQQREQPPEQAQQQGRGEQGGKRRRIDSAAEREASPTPGDASEGARASCFYDTVGCVVLAPDGSVAAGVSSGGILLKTEGRVGEAAAFGAGCWAQASQPAALPLWQAQRWQQCGAAEQEKAAMLPALACSVTGVGEAVMRHLLARDCCTAAAAAAQAASQTAAAAPASSPAGGGSNTEDAETAGGSDMPLVLLASRLLQRTVMKGPPPHDCGLLCLRAQPIDEAPAAAAQQQNGSSAGGQQHRQPRRYAVEVSVAHSAPSMAFGHMACAQPSGGGRGMGGGASAAGRAAAPQVYVLRRTARSSGHPLAAVQTYTHGTTLLL